MNESLYSSARHGWRTRERELDLVRAVAPIRHDPCTSWTNPTRAQTYHAPSPIPLGNGWQGPCGLRGVWPTDGLVWIQPPYGRFLAGRVRPDREVWRTDKKTGERIYLGKGTGWAERIIQHQGPAIAFVPGRFDAKWHVALWRWADVECRYTGRVSFIDEETGVAIKTGAPFPVSFFFHGSQQDFTLYNRFCDVFSKVGELARKIGE